MGGRETAPLALLRQDPVQDTEPNQVFEDLTRLASQICGTRSRSWRCAQSPGTLTVNRDVERHYEICQNRFRHRGNLGHRRSHAVYWFVDITGRRYSPPGEYPHFFSGFLGVALAWQLAFLMIGASPARLRALMIPGTIEKFGYVATTVALYALGHIAWVDAQAAVPDRLLGVLFVVAFLKTRDV
jgi:hypothetical protein